MGGRRKPKDERIQEIKKLQETCERIQENEVKKRTKMGTQTHYFYGD